MEAEETASIRLVNDAKVIPPITVTVTDTITLPRDSQEYFETMAEDGLIYEEESIEVDRHPSAHKPAPCDSQPRHPTWQGSWGVDMEADPQR